MYCTLWHPYCRKNSANKHCKSSFAAGISFAAGKKSTNKIYQNHVECVFTASELTQFEKIVNVIKIIFENGDYLRCKWNWKIVRENRIRHKSN